MMQNEAHEAMRIGAWLEKAVQDMAPTITRSIREGRQPGLTLIESDTALSDVEADEDGRPQSLAQFDLWISSYLSWELTQAVLEKALENVRQQAAAELAGLDLQRGPW